MPVDITFGKQRDGVFGVVNLDYDQKWVEDDGSVKFHLSRPSRNTGESFGVRGLPATARFPVPGNSAGVVELYEALEKWMYKLCRDGVPSMSEEEAKQHWKSLMSGGSPESSKSARFFTDFAGTETNRSFVLGTNPDSAPMKCKPMAVSGTIIKIVGEANIHEPCWALDAVDPLDFESVDVDLEWWKVFYPTNSVREAVYNIKAGVRYFDHWIEYISEPFHQFLGHSRLPLLGLPGSRVNYIQKSRVRILRDDEPLPSPYIRSEVAGYETYFYPSPYPRI